MKYAHEVQELFEAYPMRSFRVMEIVRYATGGRRMSPRDREAARKAVRRALDALIETGTVMISRPADDQGSYAEYCMSHLRDMRPEKVGHRVGQ